MAQNPAEMAALRTLRLSDEQVAAVRKLVRSRCHDRPGNARRFAYAVQGGIELAVVQIDGHRVVYIVDSVNLSASGVAVLHGNFIHDGTPCEVCLQTTDGEKFAVTGTVVRSECVSAPVHLLGIQFERTIDIEPFVGCEFSRTPSRSETGDRAVRVEPSADEAAEFGGAGQVDEVDDVTDAEPASREVAPAAVDAGLAGRGSGRAGSGVARDERADFRRGRRRGDPRRLWGILPTFQSADQPAGDGRHRR
jgi:hypothetical protein